MEFYIVIAAALLLAVGTWATESDNEETRRLLRRVSKHWRGSGLDS